MTGTITAVTDHGTIVAVEISSCSRTGKYGMHRTLLFDHRMFRHLVEAEAGRELVGRRVRVGPNDEALTFLDEKP